MEKLRKKIGFKEGAYVDPERLSGGLTLWWKKEIEIYGTPIFADRMKVWEEVKRKVSGWERPLICVGNFNEVANVKENEGGKRKESRKAKCFNDMIRICELNDV
ncbi:hypothetical protein CRYUN_Cryun02cG0113600 [Craigia yunnanensis]